MTSGQRPSDLQSGATDEIVGLEEGVQPRSAAEQVDLSHLGPRGMARRDVLGVLAGGAAAGLALWFGLRKKGKGLTEMSETELQDALNLTLTFNRNGEKLSYKRQLPDGRKVASYKPNDKILGRTYSTVTLEDDDDRFATTRFPDKIRDGDKVQFGRVIKASTSSYDASCDSGSCGPGKPIFEEVEIMGETIEVTPQMIIFDSVEDREDGYDYRLGVSIRGMVFICPIPWSKLSKALDRKRSQKVPLVFDGVSLRRPDARQVDRPAKPQPEAVKGTVHSFNESNFDEEVLRSELPVLVDFYAQWCGPCKHMAPIVEGFAGEFEGKVKFGKVDTDQSPTLATRYRAERIPYFLVFKGGQPVGAIRGADKQGLHQLLKTM